MKSLSMVLREAGPKLIKVLMRVAGVRTQAELADKTGLEANEVSRYKHKKAFPDENLITACTKLGLTPQQTGWLVGMILTETFQDAAFVIDKQVGEVREPLTPYGAPSLESRIESLKRIDLSGLDPHDSIDLAAYRNLIRETSELAKVARDQDTSRLESLIKVFDGLLGSARRRHNTSRRSG